MFGTKIEITLNWMCCIISSNFWGRVAFMYRDEYSTSIEMHGEL